MIRALVIVALIVAAAAASSVTQRAVLAADAPAAQASYAESASPSIVAQEDGNDTGAAAGDARVDIQLWTLIASGGAAAIGLVLFVVRVAMGWVQRPTPEEIEAAKHH